MNDEEKSIVEGITSGKPPELRYKDLSSGRQIFSVLSDETQIRSELAIARQEHPLKWTEYVLNNFHNRFPGGYKWKNFVEEKIKPSFDSKKFKTDFEEVLKLLHIKKHFLSSTVNRREELFTMIHNYEENFLQDKAFYDRYIDTYLANGWINHTNLRRGPHQLYSDQVQNIKDISDQRGEIYIGMRNRGYSHQQLCG